MHFRENDVLLPSLHLLFSLTYPRYNCLGGVAFALADLPAFHLDCLFGLK